jgi:ABC-type nitrate/sulfonate/bicarbonate transport system substrate-binding protein
MLHAVRRNYFIVLVALGAFLPHQAPAQDLLRIGAFTRDAAQVVAEEKGFLRAESIKVELGLVTNSVDLMRGLVGGKYDLVQTNADNVIAWADGQGEDPGRNDFVIVIGGSRGLRQSLVGGPGIRNIADLEGKAMAVDDPRTGYAPVLAFILKRHGLILNRDYTFAPLGNTAARIEAMASGQAAASMMNIPDDEIAKRGFKKLAQTEDYLPAYARGVGAARRVWAERNEALLVRYIKAMIRATNWLRDPKNETEALQLLLAASQNSSRRARQVYDEALDPRFGLIPENKIELEGIRAIIRLREAMGAMKPPLPAPEKYIDERFYLKAVASPAR